MFWFARAKPSVTGIRDVHLAQARGQRAVEAALVQHQARPGDASAVAGSAATTSSAPAICGTSFGCTKLATSTRRRPAAARRPASSARRAGVEQHRIVLQAVARPDVAEADQRFVRAARRRAANFRTRLGFFEPLRPFFNLYMCGVYGGCDLAQAGRRAARQISTTTGRISGRFEARL